MEFISTVFSVIGEGLAAFLGFVPKALSFILWIICGIIILPCVFIAGNLYPLWTKWAEDSF